MKMWLLTLIRSRPFVYLAIAVFLIGLIYLWRSEIYNAAENACMATVGQKTIEANNQSVKDAVEVRKNEQTKTKRDIIHKLCEFDIMYENRGCE